MTTVMKVFVSVIREYSFIYDSKEKDDKKMQKNRPADLLIQVYGLDRILPLLPKTPKSS